jgi:hypothetical protein
MWLITRYGFFSVVRKPGDDNLTIRARARADLEALRLRYLPDLGPVRVGEGTDYRYRASATHASFAEAVSRTVMDIDYSNFKDTVADEQGVERAQAYGRVWADLWAVEDGNLNL